MTASGGAWMRWVGDGCASSGVDLLARGAVLATAMGHAGGCRSKGARAPRNQVAWASIVLCHLIGTAEKAAK